MGEGGGGWGENKIGGRKEGWRVCRKTPTNERKKMKKKKPVHTF